MRPDGKNPYYEPLVLSVVTTSFVEKEYESIASSARPVIVANKKGFQYVYIQDTSYDDVILPINSDESMIIGNDDSAYSSDFSQILATLKFDK